ncbi:hypothetical protein B0H13DRAFT_2321756 [Mycena leptocephala]|nr:hypothetical protein B0H13DRAFT_2321756 [Mycena leptocephala]
MLRARLQLGVSDAANLARPVWSVPRIPSLCAPSGPVAALRALPPHLFPTSLLAYGFGEPFPWIGGKTSSSSLAVASPVEPASAFKSESAGAATGTGRLRCCCLSAWFLLRVTAPRLEARPRAGWLEVPIPTFCCLLSSLNVLGTPPDPIVPYLPLLTLVYDHLANPHLQLTQPSGYLVTISYCLSISRVYVYGCAPVCASSHAILPLDVYHELTGLMMRSGQLAKVSRILHCAEVARILSQAWRPMLDQRNDYTSNPAYRCYQCVDQLPGQCLEQEVYDRRETVCVGAYICRRNP